MKRLAQEYELFKKILPELLPTKQGKFVLIHGEDWKVFEAYADALQAGYDTYGLEPFLVQPIKDPTASNYMSRDVEFVCP